MGADTADEEKGTVHMSLPPSISLSISLSIPLSILSILKFPQELLEQRKARQQLRQELSKRRSAASQNRMRIITQLAEDTCECLIMFT